MQLMLLIGTVVPTPAPQAVVDALQSVQVTTTAGQSSGFQLSFATSRQSVITRSLLPTGYFDPKTRVIVVAIVGGLPTVLVDGIITRQEIGPSDEPGASTLTLTGEDLSVLMDLRHVRACYPAMPFHARVMLICAKYALHGIIPAAVPTVITNLPNPIEHIPIQSSTDLDYIKALASEAGYVFYLVPGPVPGLNTAYWGPEIRAGLIQPALRINMGTATNVESLTFSFDGLARRQYAVSLTEPNTKITVSVPVPDISLLRPPLAARPAVALKEQPLPDVSGRSIPEMLLLGLSRTSQSSDAISGQGRLDVLRYGRVLAARQLVGVAGAGLSYDGLYYVRSVTHDIKRGEYKQSFSLTRDGLVSLTPQVVP
jgi:hypothetical protein